MLKKINTIKAVEAKKIIDTQECIVLDVRTLEEYEDEHLDNALLIPLLDLETSAERIIPNKNAKILIYCRSGNRSLVAGDILLEKGYKDVTDFGGIIDWPFEKII
ncbi:MAG: rhodanese-like domain-containing protein [bacterium]